jgi:membrane protease YdiL (CAAX protease family)
VYGFTLVKEGPMIKSVFRDEWLLSRQAAKLFILAGLLVLAVTPAFLGLMDTANMSAPTKLTWDVLGVVGSLGLFFLWFGMWRYWVKLDTSRRWPKRIWFFVLLVGFWWGSCVYCCFVYLPQVFRKARAEG